MSPILEKMEVMRRASSSNGRISLTELARSKGWRDRLADQGVMEVMDRTETAAFLIAPQEMDLLLEAIEMLEEQVEQADVDAIVACRAQRQNWQAGSRLAEQAKASLKTRRQLLDEIASGL